MPANLNQWMQEGEQLYQSMLREYEEIEQQVRDLEARLAAKGTEVNQLARMLGKPSVEAGPRLTAELLTPEGPDDERLVPGPTSNVHIARALSGKFATERVPAGPAISRVVEAVSARRER